MRANEAKRKLWHERSLGGFLRNGQWSSALSHLEYLAHRNPKDKSLRASSAAVHAGLGRWSDARADLEAAARTLGRAGRQT